VGGMHEKNADAGDQKTEKVLKDGSVDNVIYRKSEARSRETTAAERSGLEVTCREGRPQKWRSNLSEGKLGGGSDIRTCKKPGAPVGAERGSVKKGSKPEGKQSVPRAGEMSGVQSPEWGNSSEKRRGQA